VAAALSCPRSEQLGRRCHAPAAADQSPRSAHLLLTLQIPAHHTGDRLASCTPPSPATSVSRSALIRPAALRSSLSTPATTTLTPAASLTSSPAVFRRSHSLTGDAGKQSAAGRTSATRSLLSRLRDYWTSSSRPRRPATANSTSQYPTTTTTATSSSLPRQRHYYWPDVVMTMSRPPASSLQALGYSGPADSLLSVTQDAAMYVDESLDAETYSCQQLRPSPTMSSFSAVNCD